MPEKFEFLWSDMGAMRINETSIQSYVKFKNHIGSSLNNVIYFFHNKTTSYCSLTSLQAVRTKVGKKFLNPVFTKNILNKLSQDVKKYWKTINIIDQSNYHSLSNNQLAKLLKRFNYETTYIFNYFHACQARRNIPNAKHWGLTLSIYFSSDCSLM